MAHHYCFIDEQVEAQRGQATCPKSPGEGRGQIQVPLV